MAQTSFGTFSGVGSWRSTPPGYYFHSNLIWLLWKNTKVLSEKALSKKGNTIGIVIEDLADVLQTTYPEQQGFNSRFIKRFCKEKGLNVEELSQRLSQMYNLMKPWNECPLPPSNNFWEPSNDRSMNNCVTNKNVTIIFQPWKHW
jgi:hypothetical protein